MATAFVRVTAAALLMNLPVCTASARRDGQSASRRPSGSAGGSSRTCSRSRCCHTSADQRPGCGREDHAGTAPEPVPDRLARRRLHGRLHLAQLPRYFRPALRRTVTPTCSSDRGLVATLAFPIASMTFGATSSSLCCLLARRARHLQGPVFRICGRRGILVPVNRWPSRMGCRPPA